MQNTWMALALVLGLAGAGTAWAEGQQSEGATATEPSQDADEGTLEDILQSPAEETFGSPSDEGKSEELEQQVEEAVVPSSGQVAGTVKSVDMESGYFSIDTAEGSLQLHADPSLLSDKGIKEGDQIQASIEKKGEMNHVTSLMKGKGGEKAKGAY